MDAYVLCWSSYANFPQLWMRVRSVSLGDFSTPLSNPGGFTWLPSDALTNKQSTTQGFKGNPRSSHLLPPAHTLDGSAARISIHDFLMIWRKRETQLYVTIFSVLLSAWMSVYMWCHTESMIPLRAWKPPHTGNTCSTVSAIVAS